MSFRACRTIVAPMLCEHLKPLEEVLLARGIPETFRGKAWSMNCREWVYFDCYIDLEAVRRNVALAECVIDHSHLGIRDGAERGFVCSQCQDAIMGRYEPMPGIISFEGWAGIRKD
jgi:hypothetical protein